MNSIQKLLCKIMRSIWRRTSHCITKYEMSMFGSCGQNVNISYSFKVYGNENIFIGDNVHIGQGSLFMSPIGKIKIKSNVMFGPNVTIITGNHRIDVVGKYMVDVHEKLPDNDQDVIIEDDVWVGANVTILKGVTIGKGSVIGACSLVTKDVAPYTVYVGTPGIKTWRRFDDDIIKKHEEFLQRR